MTVLSAMPPEIRSIAPERIRRHELKFVLSAGDAERVRGWANGNLAPDPFAGPDASYLIHSLYLDTPGMDIYFRTAADGGTKYRIRRYGTEGVAWLERKRRKRSLVTKKRACVPLERVEEALGGRWVPGGWGRTFVEQARVLRLSPRLLISYPRFAWVGPEGSRLTLDRDIVARVPSRTAPFGLEAAPAAISPDVVLELKYDGAPPRIFEDFVAWLARSCGSFSKYGHGVEAAGLAVVGTRGAAASGTAPAPRGPCAAG